MQYLHSTQNVELALISDIDIHKHKGVKERNLAITWKDVSKEGPLLLLQPPANVEIRPGFLPQVARIWLEISEANPIKDSDILALILLSSEEKLENKRN